MIHVKKIPFYEAREQMKLRKIDQPNYGNLINNLN
jgi:hypothetical protein